jgi:hypothetical protein
MDGGAWMTTGRLEKVDAGAGVAVGGSGRWTPWPEWPPAGMGVSELLAWCFSLTWNKNRNNYADCQNCDCL